MEITKDELFACFDLFFALLLAAAIMFSYRKKSINKIFLFLNKHFDKNKGGILVKIYMNIFYVLSLVASVFFSFNISLSFGLVIFTFSLIILHFINSD